MEKVGGFYLEVNQDKNHTIKFDFTII